MLFKSPSLLQALYPDLIWKIETKEKRVFLTFDDGPHPTVTPQVMDMLESFGFKGTFFCIGDNVRKYPETYQAILDRGHRIGNHTYSHVEGWRTSSKLYRSEVERCAEFVVSDIFRPPYGRIKRRQIRDLKDQYRLIMWSLLSWDFKPKLDTNKSLRNLKRYTRPGSIVVFHDSEKAQHNLFAILPHYLSFLSDEGFISEGLK